MRDPIMVAVADLAIAVEFVIQKKALKYETMGQRVACKNLIEKFRELEELLISKDSLHPDIPDLHCLKGSG